MNLRQLQYFLVAGELESISKAAARLHVAQPALTRHMRTLERSLGVQLFARSGRGIRLTNAGRVYHERVKTILRDIDRATVEVKALSRSPGGRIDLGMPLSLSQALTSRLIDKVHSDLPGVAIRVIDGWTGFIIEWLMLGRLDLGVIYDHTLKSDLLHVEPLVAEEQFLICRPQDRLARRTSVTLAQVAALPLVLPSREHGLRFAVEDRINSIGARVNIHMEIDSIVGLRRFVERGRVYTVLPRGELEEDLMVGRLTAVRIVKPTVHRILFAAWHTERPVSPQMRAVLEIMKRETAALVSSGVWGSEFHGDKWTIR
jgi:LysR family transcriptional regulator, nitrogen assimilation regulatory protein